MHIVGRGFTLPELALHLAALPRTGWSPRFVVVHNTAPPDLRMYAQWVAGKKWTGEQWMINLSHFYAGKGWSGGPHLFVTPDKIWALTPLSVPGVHSPSWNRVSAGVETVGDFETDPFDGEIRTNLVGTLALLHAHFDMDPADFRLGQHGLHLHREDPLTTHRTCPGRHVVKSELVEEVVAEMGSTHASHADPSEATQTVDTSALPPTASRIRWVQERLVELGSKLQIDNQAGPLTRAAVRAFQRAHGLRVDGIAGSLTRLALLAATAGVGAAPGGTGH